MRSISSVMECPLIRDYQIFAKPIAIQWDKKLPVFSKEDFLKAVGDEYGWLGGVDHKGILRCILPYALILKAGFRLVRFQVETMSCGDPLNLAQEKSFLNSVIQYFQSTGADVIIPGTANAIFRTYPDGADAAPYGTYVIDLRQPEEVLWRNISKKTRQNIHTAQRAGVYVQDGMEYMDSAYDLICETFGRSKIPFMSRDRFIRYVQGLGEHGKLFMVQHDGIAQGYCLFAFSDYCAYGVYGGNILNQYQGANKLLYWEIIRYFRSLGVHKLDFFGARINPEKGSKQEAINQVKQRFGAIMTEGFIWKYPLRPWRSWFYSISVRLLRGGDIVDHERHKLKIYRTPFSI